jgi:hypothetical protein
VDVATQLYHAVLRPRKARYYISLSNPNFPLWHDHVPQMLPRVYSYLLVAQMIQIQINLLKMKGLNCDYEFFWRMRSLALHGRF